MGSWSYYQDKQHQGILNKITDRISDGIPNSKYLDTTNIYIPPSNDPHNLIRNPINLFNTSSFASKQLANYISQNKLNQSKFRNTCLLWSEAQENIICKSYKYCIECNYRNSF